MGGLFSDLCCPGRLVKTEARCCCRVGLYLCHPPLSKNKLRRRVLVKGGLYRTRATAGIGDWGELRPYLYLFNRAPAHPTPTTTQVGAVFIFFNAAGSSPAAHFLVYLCAKPTLRSARHDSGTRFFCSGLAAASSTYGWRWWHLFVRFFR